MEVSRVDFAKVPLIGAASTLARLSAGDLAVHAPMLDVNGSEFGVDSRYLNRARLADVLAQYNRSVGNELSTQTLDAMRDDARLVIAGQQPGLLTGAMLCPLKAITAICLAKKLSEQSQRAGGGPILPAFWIASEDHDLAEVNRVMMGDRKLVLDHDELNKSGANPPVGRVSLQAYRQQIINFAREQLEGAGFGRDIINALEEAPYTNYGDFFAYLMARIFQGRGLILIDPMCHPYYRITAIQGAFHSKKPHHLLIPHIP